MSEWLHARKSLIAASEGLIEQSRLLCLLLTEMQAIPHFASDRAKLAAHFGRESQVLDDRTARAVVRRWNQMY
jgi:hypothetical protein